MSEFFLRVFSIFPKTPRKVQIEITNICNLNCKMCFRGFLNVEEQHMDFEIFKKAVDHSRGAEEIILTGWGEPLSYPQIAEAIKYCHDSGFQTRLTTNGILLTNELAERLINAGLDVIAFSLESLTDSDSFGHIVRNQIENIKGLAKKENHPRIVIQTTMRRGEDVLELIRFAQEIKASVNLVRLDNRFIDMKRPDFKEEKELVERAVQLGDSIGVEVNCFHHSLGKGLFRMLFKKLKWFLGEKRCLKLYNEAYVNLKGELTPCCNLPNYQIGSVLEESVSNLWKSKKLQSFRKDWRKVCQKCDSGQIKQL